MRWAVAVLLTTRPSRKVDGWTARSVKRGDDMCPSGPTLCAVLVLKSTFVRYGNVDAEFVAMVDKPCPWELRVSLEANGVVPVEMDLPPILEDYLLMRKFYVFALAYDKVLLLDSDAIVVGSLRHLFENEARCGRVLSPQCWPETDRDVVCAPGGKPALMVAQQTAGTPILTAFAVARPDRSVWRELVSTLQVLCGGSACDRRFVYAHGWNASLAPHEWALMRRKKGRGWAGMGAGFTDQGFAEYFVAQRLKSLYSVSHRTCKLKYVHFNMPPKPWFCPGVHCTKHRPGNAEGDLRWGGHKCAQDWWWQFTLAAPAMRAPPHSCARRCLTRLGALQARRADFTDARMRNYTPRCKDWSPLWPPLRLETRPPRGL